MKKVALLLVAFLTGCAADSSSKPPMAAATRPSPLMVNVSDDNSNSGVLSFTVDNGLLVGGDEDLIALVKEVGADRPVVVEGSSLKMEIQGKKDLEQAGFKNVVTGVAYSGG